MARRRLPKMLSDKQSASTTSGKLITHQNSTADVSRLVGLPELLVEEAFLHLVVNDRVESQDISRS